VIASSAEDPGQRAMARVIVHDDLKDGRGPILPVPRIYTLWWGDTAAFPQGAIDAVTSFLTGIGGTPYLNVATQYSRGVSANATFVANLLDATTSPPDGNPTFSDLSNEVCRTVVANGVQLRDSDLFVIYGSKFPNEPAHCAFHGAAECNGRIIPIAYVPNPVGTSCPGPLRSGPACNALSPEAASIINSTAHELLESMLNPFGAGWTDSHGFEIADKCETVFACIPIRVQKFLVQGEYSNIAHACVWE
jgi:hypothetical protein